MTPENIFPTLLGISILYWILRLVLLELLTVIFRRTPPLRTWLRQQTEAGRLDRNLRSSELFCDVLRRLGRAAEWIAGRGWLRAPTFVFVATILIFLSVLPMDDVRAARAEYDASVVTLREADATEIATGACLLENALAEASRRTGLTSEPPAGLKIYPFNPDSAATLQALRGERFIYMARALMQGRALTDDPADVDPIIRSFPRLERSLDARIVDGRLTKDGYHFVPPDPESRAARDDIVALCDGDPDTRSQRLAPVRDPEAYQGIVERFRSRSLAFMNDPAVREAFKAYQLQVAASRFGVSFFFAVVTAIVLWISLKLTIATCRAPRRSIWLIINYAVVLGLSGFGAVGTTFALLGAKEMVNGIAPFASGYLIASAADPAAEADYQGQANDVIGGGLSLVEETCFDIGDASPFTGWCHTAKLVVEPWDPATRRFAFERLIPPDDGTSTSYTQMMGRFSRSPMTFFIAYAGIDKETQDRFDISLWQGALMGGFVLVVLVPWLLLCGLATLLAPLLELRWTVVKRVDRIIRERSSAK